MLRPQDLPLNTLHAFEVVGRHEHIRRAAAELCLSHTAVSRQIAKLEDSAGAQLFDRTGNRMRLTPAGQRFLETVKKVLADLEHSLLSLDPENMQGGLTIAATASITMNWLFDVIDSFHKNYPEISVHVETIEPHLQNVSSHWDIAICLGRPDIADRKVEELYREKYVPVCSPALIAKGKPLKKPVDLNQHLLLYERFGFWDEWFKLQGLPAPTDSPQVHFDYGYQVIEAARRGIGIALADPLEIKDDLQSGRLTCIFDHSTSPGETIFLITEGEETLSARSRLFTERIKSHLGLHLGKLYGDASI